MYSTRSHPALIAFGALFCFVALGFLFILSPAGKDTTRINGELGEASVLNMPSLAIEFADPVAMGIAASAHYDMDSAEGAEEWKRLIPKSGHAVHVDGETYTVTLFHQLKCLDFIREEYSAHPVAAVSSIVRHCMNHLRQTILCHPNLALELAVSPVGSVETRFDTVCRDWTRVYARAEEMNEADMADTRRSAGPA